MKKFLFIALIAFGINAKAQIIMEHDYDSASTFATGSPAIQNQLMIIKFEISGERYVRINRRMRNICIYNMNHSLLKTIDFSGFPFDSSNPNAQFILYLSEQLFDTDSGIEFMYCTSLSSSTYYIGIYNEDGSLIFSDDGYIPILFSVPLQQYPIYNTSQGTKMILSYLNGHAKVFSLPGTLSQGIHESNNMLLAQSSISNPYPNPAINTTRINYELPNGINEGVIVFYNLQGIEVKRFKVDKTFNTLLISTSDIAAGTYYYQLQTTAQNSEGKKMVVIK